jgi:hypothetical protein
MPLNFSNIERFQIESSTLSSAYGSSDSSGSSGSSGSSSGSGSSGSSDSSGSSSDSSGSSSGSGSGSISGKSVSGSNSSTIWDFLGISNLEPEKQNCVFDCSKTSFNCLGKCEDDKCKYSCATSVADCYDTCLKIPVKTTTVAKTTQAIKDPVIQAHDTNSFNYASSDHNLWPQYKKVISAYEA